jgi:hypothetical protein
MAGDGLWPLIRCNAFTSLETGLAGLNDDKREPLTGVT